MWIKQFSFWVLQCGFTLHSRTYFDIIFSCYHGYLHLLKGNNLKSFCKQLLYFYFWIILRQGHSTHLCRCMSSKVIVWRLRLMSVRSSTSSLRQPGESPAWVCCRVLLMPARYLTPRSVTEAGPLHNSDLGDSHEDLQKQVWGDGDGE